MAKAANKKKNPAKTKKASGKKALSKKIPAGRDKSVRGKLSPTKDAPWDVDISDDGDFASPRIDLDENEIKEQEDRKG